MGMTIALLGVLGAVMAPEAWKNQMAAKRKQMIKSTISDPAKRRARVKRLLWVLAIGMAAAMPRGAYAGDSAPAPVGAAADETHVSPDNSGTNVRDRDTRALTPMDQGNSAADLAITQQIRKAVMAQDGLSVDAKNVKIITNEGVVTLRGPVKTAKEKVVIEALSTKTGGVKRVDDQLEIEAKP
jgi:hyperosmotically inducible protein